MMDIRVVSVRPLYQINVGYIARISANFGVSDLRFVSPRCKLLGKRSIMYSKHGRELLESSSMYGSLGEAITGSVAVATTAENHKSAKAFFNLVSLEELAESVRKYKIKRLSVVLGGDDTGLSKEEIEGCDYTTSINTGSAYNTLNISHSLAIILYSISRHSVKDSPRHASEDEVNRLISLFRTSVEAKDWVRNKKAVSLAFKRMLKRSNPSSEEIAALSAAFSKNR